MTFVAPLPSAEHGGLDLFLGWWNYAQHAPQITPQGTLLLYDNGNYRASPFDSLVLDSANYSRAVEYRINEQFSLDTQYGARVPAKAHDQVNVEVFIPPQYLQNPADFVAQISNLPIDNVPAMARVYIDQQSGLVVVGGEVEIGPVAITHRDMLV